MGPAGNGMAGGGCSGGGSGSGGGSANWPDCATAPHFVTQVCFGYETRTHLSGKDEGQYATGEKPRESAAEENVRGSPGINRASHIATDNGPESRSLERSGEVSQAMDVDGSACGDGTDAAAVTVNC